MKIVHTYINNMYIDRKNPNKASFAHRWGLVDLASHGHEITLLCGGESNQRIEYVWNNIRIIELPTFVGINNTTRLLKGFARELWKLEVDVIHTHHYCSFIPEITGLIGSLRRIKVVITYHTTFHGRSGIVGFLERLYGLAMLPFFLCFSHFCFISDYIQNIFYFKFVPTKLKEVTHNQFEKVEKINVERDPWQILFLGRLTYLKGLDILIESFSLVLDKVPSAHLTIVGKSEGSFSHKMKNLVTKLGISSRVQFTGPLYGKNKWKMYQESSILVVPSRGEGFGNVVIEGMLSGCALVVSDKGALPEAAQISGNKALMFRNLSAKDLARKITTLLVDHKLKFEIVQRSSSYAQIYTHKSLALKLSNIYKKLVKS